MKDRINVRNNRLVVPDNVVIPFIEGDGIGSEVIGAARLVVDKAVNKAYNDKRVIEWFEIFAGEKAKRFYGDYLPEKTLKAIKNYRVALKGPLTTPIGGGLRSINVMIRQKLDLYSIVRPIKYIKGVPSVMKNPERVDIVVFREGVEDIYSGIEWGAFSKEAREIINYLNKKYKTDIRYDSGIGIKPISKFRSERIVRNAINYAIKNKMKSLTLMHKGNIMKYTEGAFVEWGYGLAKREFGKHIILENEIKGNFPKGKLVMKDRIADNMFQQLILRPSEYDIIVCPNLNGDYISEAGSALIGGIGLVPSGNIGNNMAVFEPTHGSAPKYAGQDKVNPSSAILSGAMMLDYIGWREASKLIEEGIRKTIKRKHVTYDLHRNMEGAKLLKCSEFAEEVAKNL